MGLEAAPLCTLDPLPGGALGGLPPDPRRRRVGHPRAYLPGSWEPQVERAGCQHEVVVSSPPVVASCLPTTWTAGGTTKVRTQPAQAPSCAPVAFPLIMPAPCQSTWISNTMLRPSG